MFEKINTGTDRLMKTEKSSFQNTRREKFLGQHIKGMTGSTWDASHMTSFLSKSFYSNKKNSFHDDSPPITRDYSVRRKRPGDFFFKNLRYDANTSHIGYSAINPMVSNSQTSQQKQKGLVEFFKKQSEKLQGIKREKSPVLKCDEKAKFNYQANKVKFIATDPLTCKYEIEAIQKPGYKIERMKRQLNSRYPHGMTGVESPHQRSPKFYEPSPQKPIRIRQIPMSKTSFEIDREWKSKGRVTPIANNPSIYGQTQCINRFIKQHSRGYNIISNQSANQ